MSWQRGLLLSALVVVAIGAAGGKSVWAQGFPDNSNLKLDPTKGAGDPEYRRGLGERERQREEEARSAGESHTGVPVSADRGEGRKAVGPPDFSRLPVDVVSPGGTAPAAGAPVAAELPTARTEWSGSAEEVEPDAVYEATGREEAGVNAYIGILIEEMNRPPEMVMIRYGDPEDAGREPDRGSARGEAFQAPLPNVGAGDALYARVLYDVNSDYPGPVLLQLLQRPLYGVVARGEFRLVRDRIVVTVSALDLAGETVPVDALAVGLDCACYGLSGDVSYHWWERVILPAAIGFVQHFLIARARPERRIVESNDGNVVSDERAATRRQALYAGAAAAAGQVGQILLEQAPSRQTVVIPRNTELAVMFVKRLEREARTEAPAPPAEAGAGEAAEPEGGAIPVVVSGRGELR